MKLGLLCLGMLLACAGCNDEGNYCYEYTCNGVGTGQKCFSSEAELCDSLCAESLSCAANACAAQCAK